MNSFNDTTKRAPKGERRTRQSWGRIFSLAAFCAVAALLISYLNFGNCDVAAGMAASSSGAGLVLR